MQDHASVDEQVESLATWIDRAANALMGFCSERRGIFERDTLERARHRRIHSTSTNRSFFALCEHLRFLHEEGREGTDSCRQVREVLSAVVEHYLSQLPARPRYVRESADNAINMFTDGHLLVAVSLLPGLQPILGTQADIPAIQDAAAGIVAENERLLVQQRGGKIHPTDQVHDFVTLHIVRGIDAYRGRYPGPSESVAAALRERVKDDILRLLAFDAAGVSSRFDASELAFGLALLGRFPTPDASQLSLRAIRSIVAAQAPDGAWPPARFVCYEGHAVLHVTSYEVALTLAQLLIRRLHEDDEPSCEALLPALSRAFQLVQSYYGEEDGHCGWANDHTRRAGLLESWATAIVLTFLIHYRDGLLELRQRRILKRYRNVRYPRHPARFARWPDLTPAFRGAVPLDVTPLDGISDPTDEGNLPQSLKSAIVEPVGQSWIHRPRHSSLIFYGPAGSRKTSLVFQIGEALQWPVLIISPPHFLCRGGLEGFEASAVEVFEDLARLRRVVVLFDECEGFFKPRKPEQLLESRTIGAFITAGMLPRLQTLRERRWTVFVLTTNSNLEELDEAATRLGRFDYSQRLGYPTLRAQIRHIRQKLAQDAVRLGIVQHALERYERVRTEQEGRPALSFSFLDQLIADARTRALDEEQTFLHLEHLLQMKGPPPLLPEE